VSGGAGQGQGGPGLVNLFSDQFSLMMCPSLPIHSVIGFINDVSIINDRGT